MFEVKSDFGDHGTIDFCDEDTLAIIADKVTDCLANGACVVIVKKMPPDTTSGGSTVS